MTNGNPSGMKNILNNAGMTLMEMILVIAVSGILVSASVVVFQPIIDSWAIAQSRSEAVVEVQFALDRMETEIAALKDATSVVTASASEFRFIDVDNNNIRFYVSGSNIMRNNDILVRGIQSLTFSYTSVAEAAVASPIVSPSATNLWRVKARIAVVNDGQSVTMETQVQPRNLKRS
jgi:prepilin-type N-terminal cleavage/methylation domain-containing protein